MSSTSRNVSSRPSNASNRNSRISTTGSVHIQGAGGLPSSRSSETMQDADGGSSSRSHLRNVTVRDRERDRVQNALVGLGMGGSMSPGFRSASSSYPRDLNLVGTPEDKPPVPQSHTKRTSEIPRSPQKQHQHQQRSGDSGLKHSASAKANFMHSNSSKPHSTQDQQATLNYAFRKSVTMGNISRADNEHSGVSNTNYLTESANVANNNYSGSGRSLGMHNHNNNNNNSSTSSALEFNDTKNSSVSSSLAGFAVGGYKTPTNASKSKAPVLSQGQDSSGGLINRYLAEIYKNVTGKEMKERDLDESLAFLRAQPESKTMQNETRYVEKLKIHLIHQGKHNEAKRFAELHQRLKGIQLLKNRESIVILFYEFFDKEATRVAIAAKRSNRGTDISSATDYRKDPSNANMSSQAQSSPEKFQFGHSKPNHTVDESLYGRTKSRMSPSQETGHHSSSKSPKKFEGVGMNASTISTYDADFDPTAMPNLHYSSDASLKNEIHNSQSKMPLLNQPRKVVASIREGSYVMSNVNEERNPRSNNSSGKIISFPNDYGRNLLSNEMSKPPSGTYNRPQNNTSVSQFRSGSRSQDVQLSYGQGSGSRPGSRSYTSFKSAEKDLIKDLVFVFQGIDGNLIKSSAKGKYEIVTRQSIHPSLKFQTLRLCELGFFYKKMRNYCDKPTIGLMAQGLKHALEKELQEYYRLLAIVQSQIQQNTVDTPMSEDMPRTGEEMTILKLTVWMLDCRPRLELLAGMIDACSELKGGEMCSVLYQYSLHGDPMVCSVTNSLLSTVAKPLYLMLCQWILYGELEDPYNEFFIAADSSCKKEQLWHDKYRIRQNMLPSFISMKQADRILATGKNINFLKEICHNAKGYEGRHQIKSLLERSPVECMFVEEDRLLNAAIEKAYKTTSEMVLKVLIQESKLIDHLKAIKNYLLLGQGDFIQHLLELIQDELSKPASKLFTHNTSAILESAVRATNSQFENEEILCRLDTRILPSSDKDLGWDVFCLDYKVHGPIGTVLTEDTMIRYNQLFNALWRTKRIEMILSTLWKNQTTLFKYQRIIPELGPVLHRSQLLISEMIHFVHQTQYYIMFEATECAWDRLMEEVTKATDLDEVIKAHTKFLKAITSRSLLDPESRELLNQLRGIFDSVHELKAFLFEFDSRVAVELQFRKGLKPNSEEQQEAQKQFFTNYIKQAKGKIETLYTTTQDLVRSFLLVLNRQPDLTLQCLSFRLDFNEYYHLKDSRLSQPLTFQHRRMSSNNFDPLNVSLSATGLNNSLYTSMSIAENNED